MRRVEFGGVMVQTPKNVVKLSPRNENGRLSIGAFMRQGLKYFWVDQENDLEPTYSSNGNEFTANQKLLEEDMFSIHESIERTYTSIDSLLDFDCEAEKEYRKFPGEKITIAKRYSIVLKFLASILLAGNDPIRKEKIN